MSPCTAANPTRSHVRVKQCPCGRPATSMLKSVPCCDTCAAIEYRLQKRDERRAKFREYFATTAEQEWLRIIATRYLEARARGQAFVSISPRHLQADPHTDLNIHPDSCATPAAAA